MQVGQTTSTRWERASDGATAMVAMGLCRSSEFEMRYCLCFHNTSGSFGDTLRSEHPQRHDENEPATLEKLSQLTSRLVLLRESDATKVNTSITRHIEATMPKNAILIWVLCMIHQISLICCAVLHMPDMYQLTIVNSMFCTAHVLRAHGTFQNLLTNLTEIFREKVPLGLYVCIIESLVITDVRPSFGPCWVLPSTSRCHCGSFSPPAIAIEPSLGAI